MDEILSLVLLGLGTGAIYGLLAQGIVCVFRGSSIVNLAQAAFAMAGAYLYYQFNQEFHIPVGAAIALVVAACSAAGALFQLLVMHQMRNSAVLAKVVVTLGLLIILESAFTIVYGTSGIYLPGFLPAGSLVLTGGIYIGRNVLIIFLVALAVTGTLWALYRFTQFGRATQAVAEDARVASAMGQSPNAIAAANWALGAGLAGLAGCFIGPVTGLSVSLLSDLIVPALAAAVIAGFRSFPTALVTGLVIGIVQSEAAAYISSPGLGEAFPFLLVIIYLSVRGASLPSRGNLLVRLPAVSSGSFKRRYLLVLLAGLLLLTFTAPGQWLLPVLVSLLTAIVAMSIVVVTGYSGQISLV